LKKNPMKYSTFFYLIILLMITTGCGLKSNPVVSTTVVNYKDLVRNMKTSIMDNEIALNWDFYNKDGIINDIIVERSEVGTAGNECKNCPRTYERIGRILVRELFKKDEKFQPFSFSDKKVERGKTYNYRLMLCNADAFCTEASSTEINFK
jgi:hypothetical protein